MNKLKEVFHQSADSGIPSHWVVQYYSIIDGANRLSAEYFKTENEAYEFAEQLEGEPNE